MIHRIWRSTSIAPVGINCAVSISTYVAVWLVCARAGL